MVDSLFSIGRFARVADLPTSALRHYDEVGLLPAAHVDPVTGYRFYDREQQAQARLLARLRELDVPIDEMRRLVSLTGAPLARALEALANDQHQLAGRRVSALRDLAALASTPTRHTATVHLDPAELADAVDRVAPVCGAPPFDAVLLVVHATGLGLYSTDRHRLASIRVPASTDRPADRDVAAEPWPVRVLLPGQALTGLRGMLDSSRARVEVHVDDRGLTIEGDAVVARDDASFPDLPALDVDLASEVSVRCLVAASRFRVPDERLALRVGAFEVNLTGSLARGAVDTLVPGPVLVAGSAAGRPVVLSSPARPGHHVVIMPRRP